ncbi:MAG: hypothetical protein A3A30_02395 [Candidatus Terrybacteria bacterium RIFCSPLOWO2_01_FULL_48_14]|nr:MAG: hypothetical protein A3A30_02395 [Candidatus Terrybacteria bacterium RIFCSPLOWO2_01_FULL_48_14]
MVSQLTSRAEVRPVRSRGFTLLELIIVIAILAILAVVITLALNPAETLARARDSQRLSDLGSLKSAIGLYLVEQSVPNMDNKAGNINCLDTDQAPSGTDGGQIRYSASETLTDAIPPANRGPDADSSTVTETWAAGVPAINWAVTPTAANAAKVDGAGWVSIDLTNVAGGPTIPSLPLDPRNTFVSGGSTLAVVTNDALVYRYGCTEEIALAEADVPAPAYELNVALESNRFANGGDQDRESADGGDNDNMYETGTSIGILPTGNDY